MPNTSGKTQMLHARVDPKLKASAERVFSKIGITTTEAIRLFLKQVELHKGMPFPIAIPSAETVGAVREANETAPLKSYSSFREVRAKL
jgi:DNA-damage-inducible protein J